MDSVDESNISDPLSNSQENSTASLKDSIVEKFKKIHDSVEKAKMEYNADKPNRESIKDKPKYKKFEPRQPRPNKRRIHVGLCESDVGMTEYISDHIGFSGIIKHRYSDFQVNEIDKKGNIVELGSQEAPIIEEDVVEVNRECLPQSVWDELDKLQDADNQASFEFNVTGKTKEERGVIHKAIKAKYGFQFHSTTTEKDNETIVKVGTAKSGTERTHWPKSLGQFLHFSLLKENQDCTSTVNMIAQKLSTRPNFISYAGNKDKRGVTVQRMCIKRRKAEQLLKISKYPQLKRLKFGNFSYQDKSLRLGDLSGNRFILAIRNVNTTAEDIKDVVNSLQEHGFLNYYGLQRFGSSITAPTFTIGKALLKGDWKEAVNLILKPISDEKFAESTLAAREVWNKTGDAGKALNCLRKNDTSIEATLLRALKTQGNTMFFNALFALPRNSMLLYLHAYQSLIWNKVVSKRIKTFGTKVLAGDLVVVKEDVEDEVEEENDDEDLPEEAKELKVEAPSKHVKVRFLTEDEAKVTKLEQIVHPLPGYDVEFPKNEIANWYTEFLKEDDIDLTHFEKSNKAFSLYGAYRVIVGVAKDLTWEMVNYENFNQDLILSELDKLNGNKLDDNKVGTYKALILNFKLVPSCYATMLLRELMKCDTSVAFHANLTHKNHSTEEPEQKKLKLDSSE